MTDIYVRREAPSRRPVFFAVLALVVIGVAVLVFNLSRKSPDELKDMDTQKKAESVEAEGADPVEPEVQQSPAPVAEAAPQRPPSLPAIQNPPAPASTPAPANPASAPAASAATPPSAPVPADLQAIKDQADKGEYDAAREKVLAFLAAQPDNVAAQRLASQIHSVMLFSPRPMTEKVEYVVQSGDQLQKIARNHGTTVELVQKSNNIKGALIRVGDRMRILKGTFTATVDKSDNYMIVYLDGRFFKRYEVGTGEYGKTPVGTFKIVDRIPQPTWWRPDGKAIAYGDPENLLGTHWLALDVRGYGIHGTWEPDTIGKQASAGCVRLLNEEVEELYALLPLGTEVTIRD